MKFISILDETPDANKMINVICGGGIEKTLMLKPMMDESGLSLWFDLEANEYHSNVSKEKLTITGWYYI